MTTPRSLWLDELQEVESVAALPLERRAASLCAVKHKATVQALIYGASLGRARAAGKTREERCRAMVRVLDLVRGRALPQTAAKAQREK